MTLSFDPDTLALDARHFIGAARSGRRRHGLRRPSDRVALAGHPTYGLRARRLRPRRLARAAGDAAARAGTVWINRYGRSRDHILPTGGYKASGLGKDLGREAYQADRAPRAC